MKLQIEHWCVSGQCHNFHLPADCNITNRYVVSVKRRVMKHILITLLAFAGSWNTQAQQFNDVLPRLHMKVSRCQDQLLTDFKELWGDDVYGTLVHDCPDEAQFAKIKKDQIAYDNAVEAWFEANR
jgi:hypothetical protein